ncbi:TraG family conjugative transposon ATPase [Pedobacter sp. G11]|uniref:TraG family conjugative transposon ATPase n=1 Tax=Pedobacter sp. G11 TaxID=2482728 RepID=UPI000F604503|nr:TraG family conjugative transposon ATPase [Pedobacter sp. G11]AZI24100.1 TraG family conjugative transposon ATPase [Pedobacter sp. G11]
MKEAVNTLPIYKVEQGCILSFSGDITLAYKLLLPEIFSLSDQDYEAYHQAWVKAIKVLPSNSIFHKQDWFLQETFKADFQKDEKDFLSHSSERFFNERPYVEHSCYVFLTKKAARIKSATSSTSGLLQGNLVPPQTVNPAMLSDFIDKAGQFERIMTDSGFVSMLRQDDNDICGKANAGGILERYCFLLGDKDMPIIRDIHLRDEIRIGEKHMEIYTLSDVADLPSFCGSRINYEPYSTDKSKFSTGFATPLGQLLDCNHILNQYVFIGDAQQTIKRLEAKKLRLHSLSSYSRENANGRDAINDFLNEAVAMGRIPVKSHVNVMAWSEDETLLKDIKNKVGSAMASIDAAAKRETDGQAQIWFAGLPGNEANFPMNDSFDTFLEQATCFFNMESHNRDSRSEFGIRLGERLSGRPIHVDISDEPMRLGYTTNRNKFILGPSGSGKSFFTNHMVRSYYEQGTHVLLVDVGHSYKGLCDLVGGYYFSYSEANPIAFNPFYLGKGDVLDTEKKESIKTLLLALSKKEGESFSRAEYVGFSNGLTLYYKHLELHPDIFPCFNSFYDFLSGEYLEVLEENGVREHYFDIKGFLYVLKPYYRGGEFDYLLNATAQLDLLSERFIVFELDAIKDHPILFPAVTLIIMEVFISKMRKLKGIRKMILIEECWKAIAKKGMAEYIKYLFKTVRKFFGEAVVVTQEVEDIISSPVVKQAIINNSDCKILLDQSKYQNKFDDIQQLLGLTEKEKSQILSVNRANDPAKKYKEVFVSLGGQHSQVYRTEVSLEEYLAYTTEETEKLQVQAYAEKFGSIQKGIVALATDIRNSTTF